MTKFRTYLKLSTLLLLFTVSLSQATTTTSSSGSTYTAAIEAGTAYTSVPKMDGTGTYNHYFGFQNVTDAITSLETSLMAIPANCGTGGAVASGFVIYKNGWSTDVYVNCSLPGGGTSTGIMGAVRPSCPNNSGYIDAISSPGFIACTTTGISLVKSAGITGDAGPTSSTCATCNHVNIATGNEWVNEQDYTGSTGSYPLRFTRIYNSNTPINTSMGAQWSSIYSRKLMVSTNATYPFVGVFRADGKSNIYGIVNGVWLSDGDITDTLVQLPNGAGWTLTTADEVEHYDTTGKLLSIANLAGFTHTLTYDSTNRISNVTDPAGHQLTFTYNARNYIATLTAPNGGVYQYAYDTNNNLTGITYPDGSTRQYLYGETANVTTNPITGVSYTSALTGIIDENGVRYASYWYDRWGRVNKEEHAPGLNLGIDRNTLAYNFDGYNNPLTTVTDALNTSRTYSFTTVLGIPRSTGQTQPAGSGSAAASSGQTFDANGNTTRRKDFNGNTSCYAYDLTRNLETIRIEGLPSGSSCPANLASYAPIGAQRKITTQWHATLRLPTFIAEPLSLTTYGYDATGNPLSISVQPTTDTTGAAGIYGVPSGTARTSAYGYNAVGQVTTMDGARTDVSDVTSYVYNAQYNLAQVTNALGHTTTLSGFDANGRPGSIVNPNGLVTNLYYDARGRLISRSTGSEITGYTFDGVGNLTSVAMPGGATYLFNYDAAHRLIRITDNAGSYLNYTLDAKGNRTQEQLKDSNGTLLQSKTRTFDALSRLYQDIGAYNQTATVVYDANGNVTRITDPLNRQSTNSYDALNRLINTTNPANGVTQLGYDGQGQVTGVTDPRNLTTGYTRDGLGNLAQQTSPDTGTTGATQDAAGNILTKTDAKGQIGTFTYDALNRVTSASYTGAGSTVTTTYSYDQGVNGAGHLTNITDNTGTTAYSYDSYGRLSSEVKTTHGMVYTTGYSYDGYGRLTGMNYPSGRQLSYSFDAMGRITQISSTFNGTTQTVASGIGYAPFGGVKSFTFGNGQSYSRQLNLDGRIASYTLNGNSIAIGYDAASQITDLAGSSYGYDTLSRLTSAQGQSYNYDADGNRTGLTQSSGSTSYSYAQNSNRLTGIVGGTAITVSQDAVGATINDGTRQYIYDARGRLTQTTTGQGTVNYEVNALGLRVRKQATSSGTDTLYFYDTGGHLIGEAGTGSGSFDKEYVYLGGQPVAVLTGTTLNYIHADHLNTPRLITNTSGAVVWQWDNTDPFGNNAANENPSGAGQFSLNLRFPGQYFDRETNTHYNINRDYDPATGRYIESDPIGLGGGINTYTYVRGNSVSRIDPLGLSDVVFDRGAGTITITNSSGNVVGTYPAANNTTSTSNGSWPNGTYDYSHYMSHPESGPDGPYGSNGNFVFDVPGRPGMGIHSGRSGPQSKTLGCVRTTDEATDFLRNLHSADHLQTITVQ